MSRHDPLHYYRIESRELVAGLEAALVGYDERTANVGELFRLAHTLKGGARIVRHELVADLAHAMEDVLAHHRENATSLSRQELSELLRMLDVIRAALDELRAPESEESAAPAPASLEFEVLRIDASDMDSLASGLLEAQSHAGGLRTRVESVRDARQAIESIVDRFGDRARSSMDIRLRAELDEVAANLADDGRHLAKLSDSLEVELRQLAQQTSALRLIEAGVVFAELERAVFDAAEATGRSVHFRASGREVRIDGPVLSPIRAALLHLVRNAVAHGIEDPVERVARGKAATGSVEVVVERRGGRVAFVVRDDGRGIDRDAVRSAAAARGVGVDEAGRELAAEELIFEAGLSTASSVSALAGRGVGLDVARTAALRAKGELFVESIQGQGARFELVVPTSLSAIRALRIVVAGRTLLLPLDSLEATRVIEEADVVWSGDERNLIHEGQAIPLRDLSSWLDPARPPSPQRLAIVVRTGIGPVAISVESVGATRDVIVRRLPSACGNSPALAGAALDANGDPELVLDPAGLVGLTNARARVSSRSETKRKPVLVIDDSLTTRMLEQSILEAAGYEVEVAASGEEGVAKASTGRFGMFIVDCEMPGMNGYEFTREVRGRPDLRDTPVMMVTSISSQESRRLATEAGVSAYMVKGEFDQGRFLSKVSELLG